MLTLQLHASRLAELNEIMLSFGAAQHTKRALLMTTILLIRHAVNDFVKTGKLAGRMAGVHLNDEGLAQAEALGRRLAEAPLGRIYSSPMERTMETAAAIVKHHPQLTVEARPEITEVEYGAWQGQGNQRAAAAQDVGGGAGVSVARPIPQWRDDARRAIANRQRDRSAHARPS